MACCMRNCYGVELDDVKSQLKDLLPKWLLDFLLDLSKCSNSQSQRNGIANFNNLNIFAAKEIFDKLDEMDRDGSFYDLSSPEKIFAALLTELINKFDYMMCNGGSKDIDDLNNKYNGNNGNGNGNKYPSDLTDAEKNKIRDLLDDNNNYNDNLMNPDDRDNSVIIGGGGQGGNGSDDLFGSGNGKGDGNPLYGISNDEISNIDLSKKIYKCFEPTFRLANYVYDATGKGVFLTNKRKELVRRVHDELLMPIFKHYYGENAPSTCQMRILMALASLKDIREIAGGNAFSRHLYGDAVDFTMIGVEPQKFLADLKSGALKLGFGVLVNVNGTHITLPYTFEGLDVKGVILSSPKQSRSSLEIEFI